MTVTDVLKQEGIFFKEETINGIRCSVGYIKQFRWSWMATQLNLMIVVGETDQPITGGLISDFSLASFQYATRNHKGWPRGLQAGVGSIAILKGGNISHEAVAFCQLLSRKHWSAFEVPVICDVQNRQYYRFQSNPLWGRIYFPFIAKTIDNLITKLP